MEFTLTISVVSFLLVFQIVGLLDAQDQKEDPGKCMFYDHCIGRFITSCEGQASLMDSESPKIRCIAALACLKANFYKTHKEHLLAEMDKLALEPKRRAVDYFLVKRFHYFLNHQDVGKLLAVQVQRTNEE